MTFFSFDKAHIKALHWYFNSKYLAAITKSALF